MPAFYSDLVFNFPVAKIVLFTSRYHFKQNCQHLISAGIKFKLVS
jgi:hypothetical protein